jgi:hypothetical protein
VDAYLPATDMPRFLGELAALVDLGGADLALVRRTAPVVLAHEAALTAALYDRFLAFPQSARFFLGEDGAPDQARLERRKHSLAGWLRQSAEAATSHEFAYYTLAVGLSHSHRAQGPAVPPHLVVGAMSLVQTALADLFRAELGDAEAALAASRAWNKWLLVQLAGLLLGYTPPRPA